MQQTDGSLKIATSTPLTVTDWGFYANSILKDAENIYWPDKDLIKSLWYVLSDYAEDTQMICTDSTKQRVEKRGAQEFFRCGETDMDAVFLGPPHHMPATVPFRFIPGNIVPKNNEADADRLICNASWHVKNAYASAVRNLSGYFVPIAAKYHVHLLDGAGLEWMYIESNNEVLEILEDWIMAALLPLLAIIDDLKVWFLQLAIEKTDYWEDTCNVRGRFRKEVRRHMGSCAAPTIPNAS